MAAARRARSSAGSPADDSGEADRSRNDTRSGVASGSLSFGMLSRSVGLLASEAAVADDFRALAGSGAGRRRMT
jgi:hypothetical protein